jgi:hypothetical protein
MEEESAPYQVFFASLWPVTKVSEPRTVYSRTSISTRVRRPIIKPHFGLTESEKSPFWGPPSAHKKHRSPDRTFGHLLHEHIPF